MHKIPLTFKSRSVYIILLTLGTHAPEGYGSCPVCVSVCLSATLIWGLGHAPEGYGSCPVCVSVCCRGLNEGTSE